jgi:heat-inducible transcriptional repressor
LVRDTARTISFVSSSVGICGSLDEDDFFSAGLSNLLREPEFARDSDFFKSLEIFDYLDKEIKNIFNEIENDVQVFIGRESRDKKFDDFSLVVSRCENKRMKRGIVGVLGPKRMDYKKNIQVVRCTKKAIKEL